MKSVVEHSRLLDRAGPALAATLAAAAALPGLGFPFLSDDWHLVASVESGGPSPNPYGFFRPLYTATFWLDSRLWGRSPFFFHLTNLLLMAAAAALVVIVVRRYTGGDGRLAALTGLLFALHPYHVENAAWIAVRGDPLYSVFFLASAWCYDVWRRGVVGGSLRAPSRSPAPAPGGTSASGSPGASGIRRSGYGPAGGLPSQKRKSPGLLLFAIVLFEISLLAKETAVVLPVLLAAMALLDRSTRRGAAPDFILGPPMAYQLPTPFRSIAGRLPLKDEMRRGLLPMGAVALAHFLVLRPLVMSGPRRTLAPGSIGGWVKHALGYVAAAVLPIDAEILADRPLVWGGAAALGVLALLCAARLQGRRIPPVALAAAALFCVLLAPSIVGFQERYLYLPIAGSCLFLAALVLTLPPRGAWAAVVCLAVLWISGLARHWGNWSEAAAASRRLVSALVVESRELGTREIVLANAPFRVRGGSVAGDFGAAIGLSGGRAMPVSAITYVSYPGALEPRTESGSLSISPNADGTYADVRMHIPERAFSHYVAPRPAGSARVVETPHGKVFFEPEETVRVRIAAAPDRGRAAYAWTNGKLVPLFAPAPPPRER